MVVYSIIVHYNTSEAVCRLIDSMRLIQGVTHKAIIVDNQSGKEEYNALKLYLSSLERNDVELIQAQKNGGFGFGVNRGIDHICSIEEQIENIYIHVINSDTLIIDGSYLLKSIKFLENDKTVGLVGPKVFMEDGKTVQNTILPITSLKTVISFKKKYSNINLSENARNNIKVGCLNGVCFIMPLSVFKEVGGFCEDYFMYNEEQDLCYNITKASYSIFFLPYKSILHFGAYQTDEQLDWRFMYKRRNQVLFIKKYQSKLKALFLASVFAISSIPKFLSKKNKKTLSWSLFVKSLIKAAL